MTPTATLVNLTNTYGANNPEIKKLWNYLYIAEGSDWERQASAWFEMQGLRYAKTAETFSSMPPAEGSPCLVPLVAATVIVIPAGAVAVLAFWLRRQR